jgi:hypothetical protein
VIVLRVGTFRIHDPQNIPGLFDTIDNEISDDHLPQPSSRPWQINSWPSEVNSPDTAADYFTILHQLEIWELTLHSPFLFICLERRRQFDMQYRIDSRYTELNVKPGWRQRGGPSRMNRPY